MKETKMTPEEVAAEIRGGAVFRIERQDACLIDRKTGVTRYEPGVRVYLMRESGRWFKTALWLLGSADKVAAGETLTAIDSLEALVAVLKNGTQV